MRGFIGCMCFLRVHGKEEMSTGTGTGDYRDRVRVASTGTGEVRVRVGVRVASTGRGEDRSGSGWHR